ncbi:MAG TPA: methyltransferase [Propionibacteriaceae bacterium]|nr:methyltransferase [Propionibacteriaceae bacterium]
MTDRVKARLYVGAQIALLAALVLWPRGTSWATPLWLLIPAEIALATGLAVVLASGWQLGRALTPSPVPTAAGTLRTHGLYGWVRHPIYSGLMLMAAGLAAASRDWLHVGLWAALVVLLTFKARWEERLLRRRYPSYPAYERHTPRFLPRLGGRRP